MSKSTKAGISGGDGFSIIRRPSKPRHPLKNIRMHPLRLRTTNHVKAKHYSSCVIVCSLCRCYIRVWGFVPYFVEWFLVSYLLSSLTIILLRKRELVTLL